MHATLRYTGRVTTRIVSVVDAAPQVKNFRTLVGTDKDNGEHVKVDNPLYDVSVRPADVHLAIANTLDKAPHQDKLEEALHDLVFTARHGELFTHFSQSTITDRKLVSDQPQYRGVFFTSRTYGSSNLAYHCSYKSLPSVSNGDVAVLHPRFMPTPTPVSKCETDLWMQYDAKKLTMNPLVVGVCTTLGRVIVYPGGPYAEYPNHVKAIVERHYQQLQDTHHLVAPQENLSHLLRLARSIEPKLLIPRPLAQAFTTIPFFGRHRGGLPFSSRGHFVADYLRKTRDESKETEIRKIFRQQGDSEVFDLVTQLNEPGITVQRDGSRTIIGVTNFLTSTVPESVKHWKYYQYTQASGFEYLGKLEITDKEGHFERCTRFFENMEWGVINSTKDLS